MTTPPEPPPSEDEARRQRQDALSALAHSQAAAPPASPAASASGRPASYERVSTIRDRSYAAAHRSRRLPRWLIFVSAGLALVVVAGIVLLHQVGTAPASRSTVQYHTPVSMVIVPSQHGLACLQDVAWSPDGKQLAVIGYQDQCPSDDPSGYNYQPGVLQIYAVATGQLVRSLSPDVTVLRLPGLPAPPANAQPTSPGADTSKTVLEYTHVLWSPDGQQLALTFAISRFNATDTVSVPAYGGLVLFNSDGTFERAALIPETYARSSAIRWDIARMGSSSGGEAGEVVSVPPAQSYSWTAGQLFPEAPLSSPPVATAPVGDPDGGNTFSISQPGRIVFDTVGFVNGSEVTINPGIYTSFTAFAVWSPDGRYVIASVSQFGIVHPVGERNPTAAGLQTLGDDTAPNLPIRDRALQHLLVSLTPSGNSEAQVTNTDDIAWSPSGHILAAIPDNPSSSGPSSSPSSAPVTLYDSATGTTMETLHPYASNNQGSQNSVGFMSLLYWSADGSHILAYSDQLDTITIWGPVMSS